MPTQIVPGDILAIRAWATLGTQAAVNTYNFLCNTTAGASVTDQDFADAMDGYMSTFYTTYMGNSAQYNGVQCYFVRRIGATFLPPPVSSVTNAGPGTASTDAVPKNTAAILRYFSNVKRGPGGRGRVFLPFAGAINVGPTGDPIAAFTTLMQGFINGLTTAVVVGTPPNTANFFFILLKRATETTPLDYTLVTDGSPANKFGQQHKRGDYGRPNSSPI